MNTVEGQQVNNYHGNITNVTGNNNTTTTNNFGSGNTHNYNKRRRKHGRTNVPSGRVPQYGPPRTAPPAMNYDEDDRLDGSDIEEYEQQGYPRGNIPPHRPQMDQRGQHPNSQFPPRESYRQHTNQSSYGHYRPQPNPPTSGSDQYYEPQGFQHPPFEHSRSDPRYDRRQAPYSDEYTPPSYSQLPPQQYTRDVYQRNDAPGFDEDEDSSPQSSHSQYYYYPQSESSKHPGDEDRGGCQRAHDYPQNNRTPNIRSGPYPGRSDSNSSPRAPQPPPPSVVGDREDLKHSNQSAYSPAWDTNSSQLNEDEDPSFLPPQYTGGSRRDNTGNEGQSGMSIEKPKYH